MSFFFIGTANAQMTEGFEGGAVPAGWTQEYVSAAIDWTVETQNENASVLPRTGTYLARFLTEDYGDVTKLVTPQQDLTTLTTPILTFYYTNVNWASDIDELRVYYKNSAAGPWVQIGVDYTAEQTAWTEVSITLPNPTNDYYIAFEATSNWARGLTLDDVSIAEAPTCLAPISLSASNIAATSADLSWIDASGGAQFDYEYVVQAAGTGMPAAAPGTGTTFDISSLPAPSGVLTASTAYEFWVRADCGGGGFSTWAGPFNFTTACAVFTAPFNQPFATNALPSCWSQGGATPWEYGSNVTTPTGFADYGADLVPDHTAAAGTFIGMDGSDNTNGEVSTLLSPFIDVTPLTTPRLRYAVFSNNVDDAARNTLDVEVYDGAAWNTVNSVIDNLGTNWVEFTTDLTTLTITGPIQIRFTVTGVDNGGFTFYNDILIDDVIVEETPSCLAPTTLAATNITATSVDLSWVDGSAGLQFDYEYVVQAAGTGMPAVAPGTGTTFDISSLPAPSGLLTANTAYEFWVRSDCGGSGYSTWTGPYNFTTACDVITVFPYTENFEANTPCWTNAQISGTDNWLRDPAGGSGDISGSHGGTGFMEKNYNTSEALLFSPQFDLTALGTDGRVKVWLHRHASADVDDEYVVYVNTSKSLTGATQLLDLYSLTTITPTVTSTGWYEYVINIPTSFNTSNSVYIIFQGITTAGFSSYDLGVDDFTLEAVPSCTEPTGLAVTNLTDASADVSWTATTGNYEYVLDGVATDPAGLGTALAAETYAATLTPSTTYYFHVRTVCAGSTYSTWSTISFTSPATPPANDECSAAIGLTVNADYLCGVFASGTTAGATDSGVEPTLSVSGYPDNDVWYSFVATQTAHRITLTNVVAVIGTDTDMGIGVYNGPCGALTLVGSSDPDTYNLTGLTIGNTYLVNVYGWYELADDGAQATFDICVGTDPALNSSSFDSNAFLAYPNPVKDVLNLEYNSEISSVRVMNLLGQEVISRNINANSTQVDMSQLSAGAYIVNVTVGDAVKTIKVVKQ